MSPMSNSSARKRHAENTTPKGTSMPTDHRLAARTAMSLAFATLGAHDKPRGAASLQREATVHALLAIHDLLDQRLPGPITVHTEIATSNLEAFKHEAETPMRGHGDCCDDPDDALAQVLWDHVANSDFEMHYITVRTSRALARIAREHITDWRADEVERLLAANRDLMARAETAEADVERHSKSADKWCNLYADKCEEVERLTRERDEWRSKFEQTDNLLAFTRDERDEYADWAERRATRYAALREDVYRERINAPTIAETVPLTRILDRDDERGGEQS